MQPSEPQPEIAEEMLARYEDFLVEVMSQILATGRAAVDVGDAQVIVEYPDR